MKQNNPIMIQEYVDSMKKEILADSVLAACKTFA